MDESKKRKW